MTWEKILVHVAGTPLGGVQFCARCGATLYSQSNTKADYIPTDSKCSIKNDGLPLLHYGELDPRQYVVCVPEQAEVHGTLPA